MAALTSATVVLVIFMAVASAVMTSSQATMAVYPDMSASAQFGRAVASLAARLIPGVVLALIAAWRTSVHARQYVAGRSRGWRGVAEAGMVGAALAVPLLGAAAGDLLIRPMLTLMYVGFYLAVAAGVGATLGLILRTTALAAIRLTSGVRRPH